jgi:hypothetical protein
MFKAFRISILLFILFFVAVSTWLTQARSTDWNNSLWVKIYPINADGSDEAARFIDNLQVSDFEGIETFIARETERYAHNVSRPVRIELGTPIREQPPELPGEPNMFSAMTWSLKMRWWSGSITDDQDKIDPDVRIFVRYHRPGHTVTLENSVGAITARTMSSSPTNFCTHSAQPINTARSTATRSDQTVLPNPTARRYIRNATPKSWVAESPWLRMIP